MRVFLLASLLLVGGPLPVQAQTAVNRVPAVQVRVPAVPVGGGTAATPQRGNARPAATPAQTRTAPAQAAPTRTAQAAPTRTVPVRRAAPAPAGIDACQGRLIRPDAETTPSASYHRFFEPGEATVQVSVVGAVQQPGLYEIAVGTDIGHLLALSGGPRYEARESGRRRRVELRLFRPEAGTDPIYATTMEDAATNTTVYPALCEGDTFLVDVVERRAFGLQEFATIAGGVSAVALLIGVFVGGN